MKLLLIKQNVIKPTNAKCNHVFAKCNKPAVKCSITAKCSTPSCNLHISILIQTRTNKYGGLYKISPATCLCNEDCNNDK